MRAARRACTSLALLILGFVACAQPPAAPRDLVEAYFRYLGHDPARLLPLLTPGFHARHGITMERLEGWMWGEYMYLDPVERSEPIAALAPVDAPRGPDAAEYAWLQVMVDGRVRRAVQQLVPRISSVDQDGDHADVWVRIQAPGSFGFRQRFVLVRGDGGRWRIDSIEQKGVTASAALAAFAAYPNQALLDRVRPPKSQRGGL